MIGKCSAIVMSVLCWSEVKSPACSEESIAGFIDGERQFVPGVDYLSRFQAQSLDASAREESVAWILKVQAYYGFHPLTAYLSVNYLDRFIYSRRLPEANGWPWQLLSVTCLSLAAKMEEPVVPSLLDLQVEDARYVFEPRTIQRMELLVLTVLDWRLRSITPFTFIPFFASKLDATTSHAGSLIISRATQIILSKIREASLLKYRPSCIAAAATLCAANEVPKLSLVGPEHAESWCEGLSRDKIISCYRLMQEIELHGSRRNPPKDIQQLCATVSVGPRTRPSREPSSPSSASSSSPCKKRKLINNRQWENSTTLPLKPQHF